MPSMPVYHKTDAPDGVLIDNSLWQEYKDKGFVDSPAKLNGRKVFTVPDISHMKDSRDEIPTCLRCGREKHKGFCKKVKNEQNIQ